MVIVVYVSLWPMLLGTLGGIRAAPAGLLEVARISIYPVPQPSFRSSCLRLCR